MNGNSIVAIVLLLFEGVMIAIFAFKGVYGDDAKPRKGKLLSQLGGREIASFYPMFQDVHVMIFVGFGFLMTFLKKYGYGAVGFNLLLAGLVVQWAMIVRGAVYERFETITVNIGSLITSEFAAAAVLISFGAVLGKASPLQLTFMVIVETILYVINEMVGVKMFKAVDIGGSIFIHTFGAYFGLAVARTLHRKGQYDNPKEGSVYHSDIFSMIGTVFLWMYWPSFNSAVAPEDSQHRAVVNTYLSIAASCITAFGLSALINGSKFNMVHIQNATLAGGVAVGATADMVLQPYGALCIGATAGMLSAAGYHYLQPILTTRFKLHDTCGVNNLHGMPGLLAGICSIIVSFLATPEQYGYSLYTIFPTRANETVSEFGESRSAGGQALMQGAALLVTFLAALVTGGVTGMIMSTSILSPPTRDQLFDDTDFWSMPDEGIPLCSGDMPNESVRERSMSSLSHRIKSALKGQNVVNSHQTNGVSHPDVNLSKV